MLTGRTFQSVAAAPRDLRNLPPMCATTSGSFTMIPMEQLSIGTQQLRNKLPRVGQTMANIDERWSVLLGIWPNQQMAQIGQISSDLGRISTPGATAGGARRAVQWGTFRDVRRATVRQVSGSFTPSAMIGLCRAPTSQNLGTTPNISNMCFFLLWASLMTISLVRPCFRGNAGTPRRSTYLSLLPFESAGFKTRGFQAAARLWASKCWAAWQGCRRIRLVLHRGDRSRRRSPNGNGTRGQEAALDHALRHAVKPCL